MLLANYLIKLQCQTGTKIGLAFCGLRLWTPGEPLSERHNEANLFASLQSAGLHHISGEYCPDVQ